MEAINIALKEFNISKDEFEDLIIPNLSFGKDRKRRFDYGERRFTAILNENLEIIFLIQMEI